jgi:hypothetical protein
MIDLFSEDEPVRGRISQGPTDQLVERTLEFVFKELAEWRDDPDRPHEEAEERLNAQFCKYLNVAASNHFPMVLFFHEEKQTGIRRVDVSASPKFSGLIGQTYHTIYDPFLVLEGKRLPAPTSNREREYVTGGLHRSGGIQRFKLGLHGAKQTIAAIIGYVQAGDLEAWRRLINEWISELAGDTDIVEEKWSIEEQLTPLKADPERGTSSASSVHNRVKAVSPEICIRHIWVAMHSHRGEDSP